MKFSHAFIERPIFATVLALRARHRRRHRLFRPADRPISRDRAAHHRGAGELSGRRRQDGRRNGRDADRAGDQRRREHDLHVVLFDGRRQRLDHRHLQARHQPRYGAGAGAEPRRHRDAAPARRGEAPRRHDAQILARPDDGRAHALARQHLRPALRLELRPQQRARRAAAARRRRRPHHLRRAAIFAARLARSRQALGLRHDVGRRGQGHPGAERPGLGRRARPGAGQQGQRLPAHRDHAGAVRRSAPVPQHHRALDTGRAARAGAGRGARRARRAGLFHQLLPRRQAGRRPGDLPAARPPMRSTPPARSSPR